MRILMSLLRVLFGVSLGIGYFAGIMYLPRPYPAILGSLFFWLISAFCFYSVFRALRTGRMVINARTKFMAYDRGSFEFWFYILLCGFAGVSIFGVTIWMLFPSIFSFLHQ
jgi:hypothetical protein